MGVLVCGAAGQAAVGMEEEVELPDRVMREVTGRVLRHYFKPAAGRDVRTVKLAAAGLKPERVPKIRGVRFELLTDEEAERTAGGVHFFKPVYREGDAYTIDFGRGSLECDAVGDTWDFRVAGRRVLLSRTKFGWGQACTPETPARK